MIQFYGYSKCSSCQKAKKFLSANAISFKDIDITEQPPDKSLLKKILNSGEYQLKQLFNTSGQLYREMGIKDKIPTASDGELLELLSRHGKLIKRPVITDGKRHTVGFREEALRKTWL